MDATRTDIDFLCRAVEVAVRAGARTINLPDTALTPLPTVRRCFSPCASTSGSAALRRRDRLQHPQPTTRHGDAKFFLNRRGVRQIQVTINGIGERANTALEVDGLHARTTTPLSDRYRAGDQRDGRWSAAAPASRSHRQAVVDQRFAHESGIHQTVIGTLDLRDRGARIGGPHEPRDEQAFRRRASCLGTRLRVRPDNSGALSVILDRPQKKVDDAIIALRKRTSSTPGRAAEAARSWPVPRGAGRCGGGPRNRRQGVRGRQCRHGRSMRFGDRHPVLGHADQLPDRHGDTGEPQAQSPSRSSRQPGIQGRGVATDIVEASIRATRRAQPRHHRQLGPRPPAHRPPLLGRNWDRRRDADADTKERTRRFVGPNKRGLKKTRTGVVRFFYSPRPLRPASLRQYR
jgi:hypothetical protein